MTPPRREWLGHNLDPPPDEGPEPVTEPVRVPVVVELEPDDAADALTAGELRSWLREKLIGVTEALLPARIRWGQDVTIDSLSDAQRGELRLLLDRPTAA